MNFVYWSHLVNRYHSFIKACVLSEIGMAVRVLYETGADSDCKTRLERLV